MVGAWRRPLGWIVMAALAGMPAISGAATVRWGGVVDSVPVRDRVVALTFDDGPARPYTGQILDVLRAQGVVATFFLVGENVQRYPELVRRIVREGHAIGNHSWSHHSLARARWTTVAEEIQRTSDAIRRVSGLRTWLFRPPYGALGPNVVGAGGAVAATHHVNVLWTVQANDWATSSARAVAVRILRSIKPGAIVLLHDGGGNRRHVVAATRWVVAHLASRGYRFVTVPELLRHGRSSAGGVAMR